MEQRTGLLRCYISSVEHSHTVPSIDTLDRIARALEVPLHSLFCDGSRSSVANAPAYCVKRILGRKKTVVS